MLQEKEHEEGFIADLSIGYPRMIERKKSPVKNKHSARIIAERNQILASEVSGGKLDSYQ